VATSPAWWSVRGPERSRRRWPRRLALAVLIALGAIAVLSALVGPTFVRGLAERRLSDLLGRRVVVSRVRVNPFLLVVTARGVRVYEPDGRTPFLSLSKLRARLEARSLVRRGFMLRDLRLDGLRARIVRERVAPPGDPLAGFNFSDIVARLRGPRGEGGEGAAGSGPPRFSLSNVRVAGGDLSYEDRPTRTRHELEGLALGVPLISTMPGDRDALVEPALRGRLDGAAFELDGRAELRARWPGTTAHVRLAALDLRRWLPYLPLRLPVEVASAWLSVDVDLAFVRRSHASPTLVMKGRLVLERLAVNGKGGAPRARLDELEVNVRDIDLGSRRFSFDKITLEGLDVRARRRRDGILDWQRVFADVPRPRPAARPAAGAAGRPGPRVEIGELAVVSAAVRVRDEHVSPPLDVALTPIDLTARHLSNATAARAETSLALRAAPGGRLSVEGTLSLEPLSAEGTVTCDVREPGRLGPSLRELVAIEAPSARLRVSGRFRAGSRVRLRLEAP
jgi:hypothetical protein